jgi:hypothetical protein
MEKFTESSRENWRAYFLKPGRSEEEILRLGRAGRIDTADPRLPAALEEISRGRGGLYDPDVVDACLQLFREKGYTLAD